MKTIPVCLLLLSVATSRVFALEADPVPLMRGKEKTSRTILLEANVNAPPTQVFRLWTTAEGVKEFFAPAARIEPRAGGRYQIIFAPKQDPEGNSHGTNGARILKFVPGQELDFEWITFAGDELLGKNAPPFAPPAQRNVSPLPTWVEIRFEADPADPGKTQLRFAHYGFGEGELWAESQRWFNRAWQGVLDQLVAYCDKEKRS